MQSQHAVEDELWRLRNFDASKVQDVRGEIERTRARADELLVLLSKAEWHLWWVLGDLCDELRRLDVLLLNGIPEPLVEFFRAVPSRVCTWPTYPYGADERKGNMTFIPEMEDPFCPVSRYGFEGNFWENIAFLPCTIQQGDLESVFGQGEPEVVAIGGSRQRFSLWMRQITRVLEFSPWIGFCAPGEPGCFVTFWSKSGQALLETIVAALDKTKLEYGLVRVQEGTLVWKEGPGDSGRPWGSWTGWWGSWGEP